ncbi:NAD-dependent epimerase/dehydratase family protein [Thermoflexus sp.]|uniref:NAD-dependent epimerase/dehydratase family protein n=1 Tax=Thermoflexus sp. TaxID=1969742 RepID=UPI0025D3B468|nr:NAD-dependent epimerase/dehydratase family protein [Thermoflexus sp.]MDW8179830.1 NAD-dependent epimerase/dehydratase family protein [Anaerolineae bacterium]MCS6963437.1 NAD-dependent epimerase/dehydratase family protein [Thermoflexus sp.]MCS7350379.1 NAD-dependent epimerase/dehydratase family protein [Thermoflexus sp.]MCX7689924.1 NAD-dependent epimerase/dehydratase family protein [Thermoflexus sp.]MDW8184188.1 NAD-dependent epimerase/dehydratase family protein [Anaerolineae bacterium]
MPSQALITGGAGFIGSNLADALASEGWVVWIFDLLARPGVERNLAWLQDRHGGRIRFVRGDLRDFPAVAEVVRQAEVIFHLAAQVAVTTSLIDPRTDFEINALGTLNVLEAARQARHRPIILYTSTNKVYGAMEEVPVVEEATRYRYADRPFGIDERQPLDFHSPYGCSKGAADQYVRDYARIYGLPTVVFRMSCIYGPRQFGTEDQGWVAHFVISAMTGRPITIYGDGKQVRDLLFVTDLIAAMRAAVERIHRTAGQVYNIGGGPENTLSVWHEFAPLLSEILGRPLDPPSFGPWRPGDQKVYISDIRKAMQDLDWRPRVNVREGLTRLVEWVREGVLIPAQ